MSVLWGMGTYWRQWLWQESLAEGELPPVVPLSSENLDHDGVFLLETGEDAFLYVGKQASVELLEQLFGVHSVDEVVPGQVMICWRDCQGLSFIKAGSHDEYASRFGNCTCYTTKQGQAPRCLKLSCWTVVLILKIAFWNHFPRNYSLCYNSE